MKNTLKVTALMALLMLMSCNKDRVISNQGEDMRPTTDYHYLLDSKAPTTPTGKIAKKLIRLYDKCDSAFISNSSDFMAICQNKSVEGFMSITGITDDDLEVLTSLCRERWEEYGSNLKNSWKQCDVCIEETLPRLGRMISCSAGSTAMLAAGDIESNIYDSLMKFTEQSIDAPYGTSGRYILTCMLDQFLSFEFIKNHSHISARLWNDTTCCTTYGRIGCDLLAIENGKYYDGHGINRYIDKNKFSIEPSNGDTMSITACNGAYHFKLTNFQQIGDTARFDAMAGGVLMAHCAVQVMGVTDLWGLLNGKVSENADKEVWAPIVEWVEKVVVAALVGYAVDMGLDAMLSAEPDTESDKAKLCIEHMNHLADLCHSHSYPTIFTCSHGTNHDNCWSSCIPK